jgi:hypothetical protein
MFGWLGHDDWMWLEVDLERRIALPLILVVGMW